MSLEQLLQDDVQEFIKLHDQDDVVALALRKAPDPLWGYASILDQIKVRQKARLKSPDLYDADGIIFPKNELYEQSSSSACAAYKASLTKGGSFIDFTAGAGIDAYYFSNNFNESVFIERDIYSAELLEHNMKLLLKNSQFEIYNGDALDYLNGLDKKTDFVFIDPQRRENGRKAIFDFSSCSPDIMLMLPILKDKVKTAMVKASPVLDIEKAILSLKYVSAVHVVQWRGECKEVLYLLDFSYKVDPSEVVITAADIDDYGRVEKKLSYKISDEKRVVLDYAMPLKYIYEPSSAFQKSGGFKSMALCFNVKKIHPNSHIYTSDNINDDFPGKCYEVLDIVSAKPKVLMIKKADLTVRNFPSTVHDLRKKLKLSDGGNHRVFATTLCNEEKKLIICKKSL